MRGFLGAGLVLILLVLVLVQGASAFNISQFSVDPSGALTPGTPVIITGTIHFEPSSDKAVVSTSGLRLSTELEKAQWNYTLIFNGNEKPQPRTAGKILSVSGWLLSNPGTAEESVRFSLSGIAPSVPQTQNKTLTQIQETNEQGNPVPGTSYEYHTVVVNFGPSPRPPLSVLSTFRSHIDEKAALGINTSAAEARYAEAKVKIQSALGRGPTQHELAYADLDGAQAAIDEGERLLDRAWAEKEVADAQEKVSDIDGIIGWFRANSSTADYPNLDSIIADRAGAVNNLSAANTEISNGNYGQARVKAKDAYLAANQTYTAALHLQYGVGCCAPLLFNTQNSPLSLAAGAGAISLLIVGIFWWRKYKQ